MKFYWLPGDRSTTERKTSEESESTETPTTMDEVAAAESPEKISEANSDVTNSLSRELDSCKEDSNAASAPADNSRVGSTTIDSDENREQTVNDGSEIASTSPMDKSNDESIAEQSKPSDLTKSGANCVNKSSVEG